MPPPAAPPAAAPPPLTPPPKKQPATQARNKPPADGGTESGTGGVDPYVGRSIAGKFQILELLGQGGMGKVYKAKHVGLDKMVCIKMLRPALLEDETVVGRFEREAKSASRLNHAHSIQILDFGQDELGTLYIAMEFVSGSDLRKTLRDEFPLGEERICQIMAQVLSALDEAHAQNVIHRDLKPENIMLEQRRGEPDFVKVLDFGIAKIQDPDVPGLTRADVVCGTPLYMSPEQATGSKFDTRADLYAIGVILYQLTTGTLPFDGANSMEILTKHVTELPVPPRTRRPEVAISAEMEALILRALDKDPAGRPQSAGEFRTELLKIGDRLKRAREDAEEAARAASTQHKAGRAQAMKEKQAAQLAQASGGAAKPQTPRPATDVSGPATTKSRLPLFAGIGVGALVIAGVVGYMLFAPPTPKPPPPPIDGSGAGEVPSHASDTTPPDHGGPHVKATMPGTDPSPTAGEHGGEHPGAGHAKHDREGSSRTETAAIGSEHGSDSTPKHHEAVEHHDAPVVGDTAAAKKLEEEAYADLQEDKFSDAIGLYRKAIKADGSYAPAYKGLYQAGVAAMGSDPAVARSAMHEGGRGYLKLAPDGPGADAIRKGLDRF